MEFFDDQILDFMMMGVYANIISILISFAVTLIKAFTLSDDEIEYFRNFARTRQHLITKYNSSFKIYCAFFLNALPLYSAILNAWYMLHVIFIPGVRGLIVGTMKSDMFALIPLVRYEIIKIEDK